MKTNRARVRLIIVCFMAFAPNLLLAQNLLAGEEEAPPDKTPIKAISQQSTTQTDRLIQKRLNEIFKNIDGLENLEVKVKAGVVQLSGETESAQIRDKATQLAERTEGVVEVQNNIREVQAIEKRLSAVLKLVRSRSETFLAYLPLVLIALAIVAVFWSLGRFSTRSDWLFRKASPNPFIAHLIKQFIRGLFLIVGVLLAFEILDAGKVVTSILGAAGLVGLAIGFAIRDTVENYISSILLGLRQPFSPNDFVSIEGSEGFIVRLTSRATILRTLDGNDIRIPNAKVFKATITNFTRNPLRRFDFAVGIGPDENLSYAQELAIQTLNDMDGVLKEPPPACLIDTLGDWNVVLHMFGWVDQSLADFGKVRSSAILLIKTVFDTAGIAMPNPTYNLHMQKPERPETAPATALPDRRSDLVKTIISHEVIDVSPEEDINRQLEEERSNSEDLLNADAPKE